MSEALPDIVLTCTADQPLVQPARPNLTLSLSVTLNASVTNPLAADQEAGLADAVLVVNDNDCPTPSAAGSTFGSCGAPLFAVQDPQFGEQVGPATLAWANVTLPFPRGTAAGFANQASPARSTLRIRGIRADVSPLRLAGADGAGAPVAAALQIRSASGIALRNANVRLAHPVAGLGLALAEADPAQDCSGGSSASATLVVKEGFASAFRSLRSEAPADSPTRVLLDFGDVPSGIELSLPAFLACNQPEHDGESAATRDALALALVRGHDANGAGGSRSAGTGEADVTFTGGSGRAVYEVVADDPGEVEDCHIRARFESRDDRVAEARATLAASFAPRGAAAGASTPAPRFAQAPALDDADLSLAACGTRLLFPFVTNQAGFDTGLVITHGSVRALASRDDRLSGPCRLHFYGITASGREEQLVQRTTPIDPGEQLVFTFSGGNPARNVISMDQFQGYVIADCGYPGARGYVFMSDGFGGIADLAMGYIAPVIEIDAAGRRVPVGANDR